MGLGLVGDLGPGPPPDAHLPASLAPSIRRSGGDLGLQRPQRTAAAAAAGMALLGLLQAGGSVLGQAMEQVTSGNLLSMLLIASAFTLSLVYLFRLAIGHLAPLPAGAVCTHVGVLAGDAANKAAEWLARGYRGCARQEPRGSGAGLGADGLDFGGVWSWPESCLPRLWS